MVTFDVPTAPTGWSAHSVRIRGDDDDDVARLMSYVRLDPSGCWIWTGSSRGKGYGQMGWQGRICYAHRVSYALLVGPLVEGLEIDHLCRVRACVNPAHLDQVTHLVNMCRARGRGKITLDVASRKV